MLCFESKIYTSGKYIRKKKKTAISSQSWKTTALEPRADADFLKVIPFPFSFTWTRENCTHVHHIVVSNMI